ncbi:hypothetical protein GN956_G2720 [Arapaima gigas]
MTVVFPVFFCLERSRGVCAVSGELGPAAGLVAPGRLLRSVRRERGRAVGPVSRTASQTEPKSGPSNPAACPTLRRSNGSGCASAAQNKQNTHLNRSSSAS